MKYKIHFRPKPFWIAVVDVCCLGILLLLLPSFFTNPLDPSVPTEFWGNVAIIFIFVSVPLYVTFGLYINATEDKINRIDYFISRKSLDIKNVAHISYHPTWVFGGQSKTLSIVGTTEDGHETKIEMSNSAFRESDFGQLVSYLILENSFIQVDEEIQKLLHQT